MAYIFCFYGLLWRMYYVRTMHLALPLRRCCVVEYFAALHEYLLCQHDDRRQQTYILLFVLIHFIVMDLSQALLRE